MEQKHAMLYPDTNDITRDQRSSAAAAMGLPVEAPPSYDVATRESVPQPEIGWSAPGAASNARRLSHQHNSDMQSIDEHPRSYPVQAMPDPTTYSPSIQNYGMPQSTQQSQLHEGNPIGVQTQQYTNNLGPNPSQVTCPACGASQVSRMFFTPNTRTHLCAFVLCLVGWCCCACIVPYCMNSCRTGNHYCAKCNAFIGSYNPTK